MSFLLKIVQGPNAGAEIALAEGTTISFGRGDSCDIILTDSALDDKAFELEVTSERVMMIFPEGTQSRMEPYHVRTVGTTAFVIGPAEGAWKEIVAAPNSEFGVRSSESSDNERELRNSGEEKTADKTKRKKRGTGCVIRIVILVLLLFISGAVVFWYLFPEKVSAITGGRSEKVEAVISPYYEKCRAVVGEWFKSEEVRKAEEEARMDEAAKEAEAIRDDTFAALAKEYNIKSEVTPSGNTKVTGDFENRIARLQATARIYRVQPGAELDFADRESLAVAIENVLSLVTDGKIQLESVTGRSAKLKGVTSSEHDLRRTIEAISKDVPKLVSADCSGVTVSGISTVKEAEEGVVAGAAGTLAEAKSNDERPVLPVVGILTSPYPCLVLQNGSRVMEGARFGEYTVKSITADSVELSGAGETFMWRP